MTADASLLGSSMADAMATPFFTWFQLVPAELPNRFRPSGDAFHDLVALDVRTDGSGGHITGLELRLARRFIDDPRNGVFARDITKSFLRAAIPSDVLAAIPTMSDAVASIEDFAQGAATVIVRAPATPRARRVPAHTLAYDVYLGRAPAWSATSDARHQVTVRMTNDSPGDPTFVAAVTSGAAA